jgi:hypothetical protein
MNPTSPPTQKDTTAWIFFSWASFIIANAIMFYGIYHAPVSPWIQGFFVMGTLFIEGSTFTLSKTIRDNAESQRTFNRVAEIKPEQTISSYEMRHV